MVPYKLFVFENCMPGKNLILELKSKKILFNNIAGFFDQQYLWKKSINILNYLDGDCYSIEGRMWDYYFS